MKKLNIVQYTAMVQGKEPFKIHEFRLVAVDVDKNADDNEIMRKSVEIFKHWFESESGYTNCELLTAVCLPTIRYRPKTPMYVPDEEYIYPGVEQPKKAWHGSPIKGEK